MTQLKNIIKKNHQNSTTDEMMTSLVIQMSAQHTDQHPQPFP